MTCDDLLGGGWRRLRSGALLLILGCHHAPEVPLPPAALDEAQAGARLMAAPMGLLRLDSPPTARDTAVIAVHGYQSEGSEWVGPLATMATWGTELYFYRWSWEQCPGTAVAELDAALDALVAAEPTLQHLVVVGHSYGGLITAMWGQTQSAGRPAQLELIAAPLAGVDRLQKRCPGEGLSAAPPSAGNTWRQWRTVHEADGAFRDMPTDPQRVELPGLEVVQLPATWEGGRLGHNRSIQWVTAELGGGYAVH